MTEAQLVELETLAVELARVAGAEIAGALGRIATVRYKGGAAGAESLRDPVSEVDHNVEVLIRARLADRFPTHGIVGEELDDFPSGEDGIVWAIDPIDGTANFVNGYPLFAGSIGVVQHGVPVVGAVWSSTSHALRPGVYHARRGGPLQFDGEPLALATNAAVRRRLAGSPNAPAHSAEAQWDFRKSGSAAIECCFVACGLLQVSRFERPNIWDVAGGIPLMQAAGRSVLVPDGAGGWSDFAGFTADPLRSWKSPMLMGEPEALPRFADSLRG